MNREQRRIDNCIWGYLVFLGIGLLWQILEQLIYGEVQPRIVDNFIAIAWSLGMVKAYQRGYRYGWEDGHGQHQ